MSKEMAIIQTERYEIDPVPIGQGGFGQTFRARDLLFDRDVVIKTILSSRLYGINEPSIRHHFFREAVVSAKLGQLTDRVVKVFDFGYDKNSDIPFFVMEFVSGGDLRPQIGKLQIDLAATLMLDLLEAVAIAHKHSVIHSDISPDNVLIASSFPSQPRFKLNDFGLSKVLNSLLISRGASLSLTGGKLGYLPPSQMISGVRNEYTDLYGIAVTVICMLTGRVPMWQFDVLSKQMAGPDLSDYFNIDATDQIINARDINVIVEAVGLSRDANKRPRHLTYRRFTDLLKGIIGHQILTTKQAVEFLLMKDQDAKAVINSVEQSDASETQMHTDVTRIMNAIKDEAIKAKSVATTLAAETADATERTEELEKLRAKSHDQVSQLSDLTELIERNRAKLEELESIARKISENPDTKLED
ncbi:MAG: protein kinase [Planctomycetaceae bacterium]|nr:protein kinase [Planctomycetaceae bacterium]